jgi:hypothetical protein
MPDSVSVPKPGDVFIGVIDFFAILVPGVAAQIFLTWAHMANHPNRPFANDLFSMGVILVIGFILGHILHGAGAFLDVAVYDPFFKPRNLNSPAPSASFLDKKYFRSNDALYTEALRLSDSPVGGQYQWSRAWLRLHSPEATMELDRLEANSKLFRSLTVLAAALLLGWQTFPHPGSGELTWVTLTLIFSLWRYCDLRVKMVRCCYLHYVLLKRS